MNKWNTIKSLIENKDFEGLQDILHDEYLYLRETTLISKDEMVSFIKKRFEDGLTFEKLELIIENKDLLKPSCKSSSIPAQRTNAEFNATAYL